MLAVLLFVPCFLRELSGEGLGCDSYGRARWLSTTYWIWIVNLPRGNVVTWPHDSTFLLWLETWLEESVRERERENKEFNGLDTYAMDRFLSVRNRSILNTARRIYKPNHPMFFQEHERGIIFFTSYAFTFLCIDKNCLLSSLKLIDWTPQRKRNFHWNYMVVRTIWMNNFNQAERKSELPTNGRERANTIRGKKTIDKRIRNDWLNIFNIQEIDGIIQRQSNSANIWPICDTYPKTKCKIGVSVEKWDLLSFTAEMVNFSFEKEFRRNSCTMLEMVFCMQ